MASKNNSIDSPTNQLAMMRLMLQQQHTPQIQLRPAHSLGEGLAYGATNAVQQIMGAIQQRRALQQLGQMQEAQRAAELQSTQAQASNLTNFLISKGISPEQAMAAGNAAVADSTVNNLLSENADTTKAERELKQKLIIRQDTINNFMKLPGFDVNNPAHMAQANIAGNQAAFGATPTGAAQIGDTIGGNLKTGTQAAVLGAQGLQKVNSQGMSPVAQMTLANYGINPVDAVSEVKRRAEASGAATDAQYKPILNDASLAHTNAGTVATNLANEQNAIVLQKAKDQWALAQQYMRPGGITAQEFMKGSAGLSSNPVQAVDTILRNPAMYGHGNSWFHNVDDLSYPAPAVPQPAVPPQPQAVPITMDRAGGEAVRQNLMNFGNSVYQIPVQAGNAITGAINNLQGFGQGLFGSPVQSPAAMQQRFNQSFAPEYPVGY